MKDILFDEKIGGSIHFTPGPGVRGCTDNGNRVPGALGPRLHPDAGNTAEVNDPASTARLVRKDGRFVVDDLVGLNPDALKG
jgi:aminopeptidase